MLYANECPLTHNVWLWYVEALTRYSSSLMRYFSSLERTLDYFFWLFASCLALYFVEQYWLFYVDCLCRKISQIMNLYLNLSEFINWFVILLNFLTILKVSSISFIMLTPNIKSKLSSTRTNEEMSPYRIYLIKNLIKKIFF